MLIRENVSLDPAKAQEASSFIDPTNFASDDECVKRVKDKLLPLIAQVRAQRNGLEAFWQRMYKVWSAENDDSTRLYQGMSDVYLPSTNGLLKTLISHQKTQTFPTDSPIAVKPSPIDLMANQMAPYVQVIQQHHFEQAKVVAEFRNWVWQAYAFGCSPVKNVWKTIQSIHYTPQIIGRDPLTGKPQVGMASVPLTLFEGPTFVPVNLLRWYVYPFNVQHIEDAEMVFEDIWRSIDDFKSAGMPDPNTGEPQWFNVDQALEAKPTANSEQLQTQGLLDNRTSLYGLFEQQIRDDNRIMTTEVWVKWDPDGSGMRKACKITLCGDFVLEIRQNPLIDQVPPYPEPLKFESTLEHFYGRSKIQNVEAMNLAQNAAFNQGIDANMFAGNPMTGVNALMLPGRAEDLEITPMGLYLFNDDPKKCMTFFDIPNTFAQNLQLVEALQTAMEKSMQATPQLQGEVAAPSTTATSDSIANAGAMVAVGEDAIAIRSSLRAWLKMAWKRSQQFLSTQSTIKLGSMPFTVDPEVLVGEYQFDFVTGQEAVALQQQQQMMAMQGLQAMQQGGMQGAAISANTPDGQGQNNAPVGGVTPFGAGEE